MKHPAQRRSRRPARARQRGQVMVLFALILPVLVGFLALSMAASLELDTKAALDQASITASIAGSSDSCMSSAYAFDSYECTTGTTSTGPIKGRYAIEGIETPDGQMPQPPFTTATAPNLTTCLLPNPPYTNCPATDTMNFIVDEHDIALASADSAITTTLHGDYPSYTLVDCSSPLPAWYTHPVPVTTGSCGYPTGAAASTTLVYQVQVSYWYYLDKTDDATNAFSVTGDRPSDDAVTMVNGIPLTCSSGGPYPDWGTPPNISNGVACPELPAGGENDMLPVATGATAVQSSDLACPTTGNFGRLVQADLWTQFLNPFGGILHYGSLGLHATTDSYGCQA